MFCLTFELLSRPASARSLTLGQFACWYRQEKRGEELAEIKDRNRVPVITPADLPPPAAFEVLPVRLELTSGYVMRRTRQPAVLNWGPGDSNFARLALFQVNVSLLFTLPCTLFAVVTCYYTGMDNDRGNGQANRTGSGS